MFIDKIFFRTTRLWTYFQLHWSSINANVGLSVSDSRDTFFQKREEKREMLFTFFSIIQSLFKLRFLHGCRSRYYLVDNADDDYSDDNDDHCVNDHDHDYNCNSFNF